MWTCIVVMLKKLAPFASLCSFFTKPEVARLNRKWYHRLCMHRHLLTNSFPSIPHMRWYGEYFYKTGSSALIQEVTSVSGMEKLASLLSFKQICTTYIFNFFVYDVIGPEVTSSTMGASSSTRQYLSIDTIYDVVRKILVFGARWCPYGGTPDRGHFGILKCTLYRTYCDQIFFSFFFFFFLWGHLGPMGSPNTNYHPPYWAPTSNYHVWLSWLWILDLSFSAQRRWNSLSQKCFAPSAQWAIPCRVPNQLPRFRRKFSKSKTLSKPQKYHLSGIFWPSYWTRTHKVLYLK